jgi:hypothetical protein
MEFTRVVLKLQATWRGVETTSVEVTDWKMRSVAAFWMMVIFLALAIVLPTSITRPSGPVRRLKPERRLSDDPYALDALRSKAAKPDR